MDADLVQTTLSEDPWRGDDRQRLVLPWPPSVNAYWRSVRTRGQVRVLVSRAGNAYRQDVGHACLRQRPRHWDKAHRLTLHIEACAPTTNKNGDKLGVLMDLDNLGKATLDALKHAGVYPDDRQIDDLRILRCERLKVPRLRVEIGEVPSIPLTLPAPPASTGASRD